VSALPKSPAAGQTEAQEARPQKGKLDIQATHKRVSKRYPKVLAELAK
jgi:hypothetical protein